MCIRFVLISGEMNCVNYSFTLLIKLCFSVAIVSMTEEKVIGKYENGTEILGREFDWNQSQKGLVLSSFFYGYITTQFM